MKDKKEVAAEESELEPQEQKKSKLRDFLEFIAPIVIALIIAMILKTFIFANAVIPTGSMLNTIQEGDRVFASKISYTIRHT